MSIPNSTDLSIVTPKSSHVYPTVVHQNPNALLVVVAAYVPHKPRKLGYTTPHHTIFLFGECHWLNHFLMAKFHSETYSIVVS